MLVLIAAIITAATAALAVVHRIEDKHRGR